MGIANVSLFCAYLNLAGLGGTDLRHWVKLAALLLIVGSNASAASDAQKVPNRDSVDHRQVSHAINGTKIDNNIPQIRVMTVKGEKDVGDRDAKDQAFEREQQDERMLRHQEHIMSLAQSFFACVSTILLFATLVYTARAANAAKRSADQAERALSHTVTSAHAASRSAMAAEEALSHSRDQFLLDNRPIFSVVPQVVRMINSAAENEDGKIIMSDGFSFQIKLANIGKMPAKNFSMSLDSFILINGMDYILPDLPEIQTDPVVLAPTTEQFCRTPNFLPTLFDEIHSGKKRMFVRVHAIYNHAIGDQEFELTGIWECQFGTNFSQYINGNLTGVSMQAVSGWVMT